MRPWLSILIPVFDVEPYLAPCLSSVLAQRLDGVEIIAVDDRSTDGSLALLEAAAARSPHPIRVVRHEVNRGISAVRNTALEAATGRYIWFLDSDDALTEGAVARLRAVVDSHSPDLVLCDFEKWVTASQTAEGGGALGPRIASFDGPPNMRLTDAESLFAGLYAEGRLHAWSKIARREIWSTDLRFPEGRYFEDMATTPRLALRARSYVYVPEVWVRYRQRAGSILSVPSLRKIGDMAVGVAGVLDAWLGAHPDMDPRTRFLFTRYCVRILGFTMKDLRTLGEATEERVAHYRRLFYANTCLTRASLVAQYLRYGNILRLVRHWRYL
ncbi:MAG: glycosyltransferase [Gemmatimonadetes bacterium]|nr:glycosyltransferase [Gemmatimonadota bacterium]